jgi:hypothetical protein
LFAGTPSVASAWSPPVIATSATVAKLTASASRSSAIRWLSRVVRATANGTSSAANTSTSSST